VYDNNLTDKKLENNRPNIYTCKKGQKSAKT